MSADLGIRAAVRAAVEGHSDRWTTKLAGFWAEPEDWRGTPHQACLCNQPTSSDAHEANLMADWARRPDLAPRRNRYA